MLITSPIIVRNYEISLTTKNEILEAKKNLLFIVDFENFLNSNLESQDKIISDHINLLTNLIHNLKNMGTVFILIDYFYLLRIRELIYSFIKTNPTTNLLLKLFIVEKTPMLSFLCIQKFEQKQNVFVDKMQFIFYEMYSNNELSVEHQIIPLIFFEKTIETITELYSYQIALRKVTICFLFSSKKGESPKFRLNLKPCGKMKQILC